MLEEFKNAFQRHNNGHIQLILINVAVFAVFGVIFVVFELSQMPELHEAISKYLTIPSGFSNYITRPWTIFTYAFFHTGVLHILFNMLTLYWFGRLFVEYLGSDKIYAVYVLGAIAGGGLYLLASNTLPYFIERGPNIEMLGASAAIDAIVVAVATLLPDYTFFLLLIGPVRIKYIAIVIVFLSFLGVAGSNAGGNIAHLGGAAIGFLYTRQLQAGNNIGMWVTVLLDWFRSLAQPRKRVKVTYRAQQPKGKAEPTAKSASKISQAEIDAILDKINDGGYESLTRDEKEKLFKAGKS